MLRTTLGFLVLLAAPLAAQQPAKPWSLVTDLGFVNAAGNSDLTTLSVGEKLAYTAGPWTLGQTFGIVYSRSDGTTTANQLKGGIRADRKLSGVLGGYLLGNYERNRFAGIARRFEEGAGLALSAVQGPKDHLDFEAGVSLIQQRSTTDIDQNFTAGRAAASYKRSLTEAAYFQQQVEFLPNLEETDDYRVNSETSLVAPLAKSLALKLGYTIRFDNLPEPGFKKTDRIFTSGLQIAL